MTLGWLILPLMGWGGLAGGGGPKPQEHDCISFAERLSVQTQVAKYHAENGYLPGPESIARYSFYPQAGILWQDVFVNNFVDQDPSSGIRDYDCTDFTYDGHRGHDSDILGFDEQTIGVPVVAALFGTVVARQDGQPDRNTGWSNPNANYVVLYHGGTHYTYYWHLRNGSVSAQVGDVIRAGQQIGFTASSGSSTYPHLHFESWNNNSWFEPSAGNCGPLESNWVEQTPIRRSGYIRDWNLTDTLINTLPGIPFEIPRKGTFDQGLRRINFWLVAHNYGPSIPWRVRLFRPDGTPVFDSQVQNISLPSQYRWQWWYWDYNFNFNVAGRWTLEHTFADQVVRAPITIVPVGAPKPNRPPLRPFFEFKATPRANEPVIAQLRNPRLIDDYDFDVVRYRYTWSLNGNVVRQEETAAMSDFLPAGIGVPGDQLSLRIEVGDGYTWVPAYGLWRNPVTLN